LSRPPPRARVESVRRELLDPDTVGPGFSTA
jgi:hypothetical protein